MLQYVNYRMRITILDGRVLVGTLMAFDRHLNLVRPSLLCVRCLLSQSLLSARCPVSLRQSFVSPD